MAVIRRKAIPERYASNIEENINNVPFGCPEDILSYAAQNGIQTTPVDIKSLTRKLGINILVKSLRDEISGYLEKTDEGWLICINSLHHPKRQRFTLAHELAHFLLHRNISDKFIDEKLFRSNESNRLEVEANKFAAALLMPEEKFKAYTTTTSSKVDDIADFFEVSALAVRVRAKELGFSGHGL